MVDGRKLVAAESAEEVMDRIGISRIGAGSLIVFPGPQDQRG